MSNLPLTPFHLSQISTRESPLIKSLKDKKQMSLFGFFSPTTTTTEEGSKKRKIITINEDSNGE